MAPGDGDYEEDWAAESLENIKRGTTSPTLLERVRGLATGIVGGASLAASTPLMRCSSTPPPALVVAPQERPKSAQGFREDEGRRFSQRLLDRVNKSTADRRSQVGINNMTAGGRLTQGGRITKSRNAQRPSVTTLPRITATTVPSGGPSRNNTTTTSSTTLSANDSANIISGTTIATDGSHTGDAVPDSAEHADPASTSSTTTTTTTTCSNPNSGSAPDIASSSTSSSLVTGASLSSSLAPPPLPSPGSDASANRPDYSSRSSSATSSLATTATSNSVQSVSTSLSAPDQQQEQQNKQPLSDIKIAPPPPPEPTTNGTMAMSVDEDPVLTFWGPDPVPLPTRFARIKQNLIAGHEAALEASWARLIYALRAEVEHIEGLGAHLIPSIEYSDMDNAAQATRFGHDLRRYGVGVVRRAVPKSDADDMVDSTVRYLEARGDAARDVRPLEQDPTCFDFFWTPAQVRARAHPAVLNAQRFMMGLWETSPNVNLVTRFPIAYADRLRIHGTGGEQIMFRNGKRPDPRIQVPEPTLAPQSADDWVVALQSSAGITAQVDNGSLERWEPDGYGRTGTYSRVFHGEWESYDPWECASRVASTIDLYNGYGSCTIFRMFQGVVALSTIEPGMIRLLPSPKLATAYFLLRPFFSPKTPAPDVRSGPEWDAYLDPSNWALERDPGTIIHGAVPGHAQRITERWHPHLHLRSSMITLPTLQPGDYILWHPDLAYHISSHTGNGLRTPVHSSDDVSMLVYVPAAPLTQTNALYLARQRKAFHRGHPSPDFETSGRGFNLEDAKTRTGEKEIAEYGGTAGLQAMGLAPWDTKSDNDNNDGHTTTTTTNGHSHRLGAVSANGESDIVELSNDILFPDREMTGC